MMPLQRTATFVAIKPQSVATNATATGQVDCLGYSEAAVDFILDSQASTTSKPAVMKLQDSDTTDATNFADITAFVGGGVGGFTIPNAGAAANNQRIHVDLKRRKRWLRAVFTSGDAAQIMAVAVTLGNPENSVVAKAAANVLAQG